VFDVTIVEFDMAEAVRLVNRFQSRLNLRESINDQFWFEFIDIHSCEKKNMN